MPTISNNDVFDHIIQRTGINTDSAYRNLFSTACAKMVNFKRVSGFKYKGLFESNRTQMLSERGMSRKLTVFAVNRHKVPRPHQVEDELELLLTRVTGDMNGRIHGAIDQIGSTPSDMVHHPENLLFVARDDARAERECIARLEVEVL